MIDSKAPELKPCPFCGGEPRYYAPGPIDHHIECVECYADIHRDTEAEAIEAWNTRASVEYDGWFYLPKPKESIVQYGKQRIEKTEHGYKVTQPVEVIESAIRSWSDELGEYIMKRICEAWSTRAEPQGVMGTRYNKLFGTPERAARTLYEMCGGCCGLPERLHGDYDAMLEWLRSDME
jgi:Lar family restriction alleviation protein